MKCALFAVTIAICFLERPSAHADGTCDQIFAMHFDGAVKRLLAGRRLHVASRAGGASRPPVMASAESSVGPMKLIRSIRNRFYERWTVDPDLIRVMDPNRSIRSESLPNGYTRYFVETPNGRLDVLPHTFEYMSALVGAIRESMQKPQWASLGVGLTDADAQLWFNTVVILGQSSAHKIVTPVWAKYAMNVRLIDAKSDQYPRFRGPLSREWLSALREPDELLMVERSLDVAASVLGHERLMLLFHQTMAQFWTHFFDPTNERYTLISPNSGWQVTLPLDLFGLNSLSGYLMRSSDPRYLERESGFADYVRGWMDGSERRVDRDLLLRIADRELQTGRREDFNQLIRLARLNENNGEVDRLNADGLRYPLRSKFSAELTARGYPPKMVDAMLRGYGFF